MTETILETLPALTVWQPHASLFFEADPQRRKWCENRPWQPTDDSMLPIPGRMVIHAAKSRGGEEHMRHFPFLEFQSLPFSAAIGVVDVIAIEDIADVRTGQTDFSHFRESPHVFGPKCWFVDNSRRFREPIAATGQQGLWSFSFRKDALL